MAVAPTVHLNGTSGEELLRQYLDAHTAVEAAIERLRGAMPNARDYYVQDVPFSTAVDEHMARVQKLQSVADELMEIALAVSEQNAERDRNKRRIGT